MRRKHQGVLFVLLLAAEVASAQTSSPSLIVANADLALGMPREKALASIDETQYKLLPIEGGFFIAEKEGEQRVLGSVSFTAGRLSGVGRKWYPDSDTAYGTVEALLAAIESASEGAAEVHAVITRTTNRKPGMKRDNVIIKIGRRAVSVFTVTGKDSGNQATIQEVLSAR